MNYTIIYSEENSEPSNIGKGNYITDLKRSLGADVDHLPQRRDREPSVKNIKATAFRAQR
jgi:hypothetical protein